MTVINIVPVPIKGIGFGDYAKALADALAATTLNVSLAGDVVIANVNISACAVVLNMNISSQSAFNLNVNIAAQGAFNMNVNIATQTADITIDIHAQHIGINLIGDWSAQQSTDVNVRATGTIPTVGYGISAIYTVPGGKTLYVTTVACATLNLGDNNPRACYLVVNDNTAGWQLLETGGNFGVSVILDKPIRIPTGHALSVTCFGAGNWIGTIYVSFLGYLTTP